VNEFVNETRCDGRDGEERSYGFDGCAIVTCNYDTDRSGGDGDQLAHHRAIARNLAIASRHLITPTSIYVVGQVTGPACWQSMDHLSRAELEHGVRTAFHLDGGRV
jgi:hypothetical protein